MAFCNLDKVIYNGVGALGTPSIEPFNEELNLSQWVGFNYAKQARYCAQSNGVHFFLDDSLFETIWNHPNKYIDNFRKCGAVCAPDFSLYADFPKAIQHYNHYRKHWLSRFYQDRGVRIIPTIAWSDEESFNWCFDGEPQNSTVAVATIGTQKNAECFAAFMRGYNEMMERLAPAKILCFTSANRGIIDLSGNVEFIQTTTFKNKPRAVS